MLKLITSAIILSTAPPSLACALHGNEESHEERRTLIVQLIDPMKQLRRGFVPADAPLTLPEVAGVTCSVKPSGTHTVGQTSYQQYNIECIRKGRAEYAVSHDCRPEHQELPEKIWNMPGKSGLTVLTLSLDCI